MSGRVDALVVLGGEHRLPAAALERHATALDVTVTDPADALEAGARADVIGCSTGVTVAGESLARRLGERAPVVAVGTASGHLSTDGGTQREDPAGSEPFPEGVADTVRPTGANWAAVFAHRLLVHGLAAGGTAGPTAARREPEPGEQPTRSTTDRGLRPTADGPDSAGPTTDPAPDRPPTADRDVPPPTGAVRPRALIDATRTLANSTDEETVALGVVQALRDVFGFHSACYYRVDAAGERLVAIEAAGAIDPAAVAPIGPERPEWTAFQRGEPVVVPGEPTAPGARETDTADDGVDPTGGGVDPSTWPTPGCPRTGLVLPLPEHGLVLATTDAGRASVTPRVDTVAALADHATTALDRIEERAAHRERERALERENERLEAFARAVSHDLRNPLNVVQGRLELFAETGEASHVDQATAAADRMRTLIEDLLTLAREGAAAGERERLDVASVAAAALGTVDAGLELVATEAAVTADRGRLRELLENLARNAVEHGDATTLRVGPLEEGFYVADDGTGIPASERDRVLDPGYSTAEGGTGFGLPIVEAVAHDHDWTLHLTEAADGGARFEFRPA